MAKVLIVDDNPSNIMVAEFILEELQIDTQSTNSADEALDCLKQESFDAILLDWMMPDIDGIEFLGMLKQKPEYADINVIVCTAKTGSSDKQFAMNAGASGFLVKPITIGGLEASLKKVGVL